MAYQDKITTTKHGRRLGLQLMSSAVSGGTGFNEYLVGPEALRVVSSTADTTATDIKPFGNHYLNTSSAGSSQVYTVEPPVPGVRCTVWGGTASEVFLKSKNSETFVTSGGSSFTVINPSSLGFAIDLVGLTTAVWGVLNGSTAAGHAYTTST
jgi:hypothetical protein